MATQQQSPIGSGSITAWPSLRAGTDRASRRLYLDPDQCADLNTRSTCTRFQKRSLLSSHIRSIETLVIPALPQRTNVTIMFMRINHPIMIATVRNPG